MPDQPALPRRVGYRSARRARRSSWRPSRDHLDRARRGSWTEIDMPVGRFGRRQPDGCLVPTAERSRSLLRDDPDTHGAALGSLLERSCMPLGPELCLTGRLAEGPFGLELHSGGGVWELDTGRRARRLLGREVEVCGRRAGFNELICDQIWPAGQPRPPRSKFNIELLLACSVVGYGLIAFLLGLVGRLG